MFVILEGCDNTGKTTLGRHLVAEFWPQLQSANHSPGFGPGLATWVINELKSKPVNMMYDRFFFSEYVYGPALRGKVCYTTEEERIIARLLKKTRPVIVWCTRPLKEILETISERPQMEGVSDNIINLEIDYRKVMVDMTKRLKLPMITYDFKRDSIESVVHFIEQHTQLRSREL